MFWNEYSYSILFGVVIFEKYVFEVEDDVMNFKLFVDDGLI